MPLHVTPGNDLPGTSTPSARITRSGCLDEAARLLDAAYRRLDARRAPAGDEGPSGAGGKFAGSSTATGRTTKGTTTTRKVTA